MHHHAVLFPLFHHPSPHHGVAHHQIHHYSPHPVTIHTHVYHHGQGTTPISWHGNSDFRTNFANMMADDLHYHNVTNSSGNENNSNSPIAAMNASSNQTQLTKLNEHEISIVLNKFPVSEIEKLLRAPGAKMPWNWWEQCYNDNVHSCGATLVLMQVGLDSKPVTFLEDRIKYNYGLLDPNDPNTLTIRTILQILANIQPDNHQEVIPYHEYLAYELLLGMGFRGTKGTQTDLLHRTVGLEKFTLTRGQIEKHLAPITRLGLHRLAGTLLDLSSITFSTDSPELRDLLAESREQPFVLTHILKRIHGEELRGKIARDCPNCPILASSIQKSLKFKLPVHPVPICRLSGWRPTHSFQSKFLDKNGRQLPRRDQVMLARSFLYLVLDVPFSSTICPNCEDQVAIPVASPTTFVNAMLECFCTPRSRFHFLD